MSTKALVGVVAAAAVVVGVALFPWDDAGSRPTEPERPASHAPGPIDAPGDPATPPAASAAAERVEHQTTVASTADATAWTVRGRTHTEHDTPAPSVPVRLRLFAGAADMSHPEIERGEIETTTVTSDARGEFAWTIAPPEGPITIAADAAGEYYSWVSTRFVRVGDAAPDDIELDVHAWNGRITGSVSDTKGVPVVGARVAAYRRSVTTADDGRFDLRVPSGVGRSRMVVDADRFAVRDVAFDFPAAGGTVDVDVTLVRESRVAGTVVDEDGAPIEGAEVHSAMNPERVVTSDAAGRFELGGLDPSSMFHFIDAYKHGYLPASKPVDQKGEVLGCELVLERGRPMHGRVTDGSGVAVPTAWIEIREEFGNPRQLALSDADGRFEAMVPRGRLIVTTAHPRFALDVRTVAGDAPLDVAIVLGGAHFLEGRVADELGSPVEGAKIYVDVRDRRIPSGATSDATGRFRLDGLPDARLVLWCDAEGHSTYRGTAERLDVFDHAITLRRGGGVAGVVVDGATGRPIPSFRIRMVEPTLKPGERQLGMMSAIWVQEGFQFNADDGRWRTGNERLDVGAVTAIQAIAPGYAPLTIDHVVVALDPNASPLVHRLFPPIMLEGQVVLAGTGAPVGDARVRLQQDSDSLNVYDSPDANPIADTDEDGRFSLPVAPGEIRLRVETSDGTVHVDGPFEVPDGVAAFERRVVIGDSGWIEGRLVDAYGGGRAGERIRLFSMNAGIHLDVAVETDAQGGFRFDALPAGAHYVSHVVVDGDRSVGELTVKSTVRDGEATNVVLRPAGTGVITGSVTCDGELPPRLRVGAAPIDRPQSGDDSSAVEVGRGALVVDGRFRIEGLAAGKYTVEAVGSLDGTLLSGTAEVDVEGGAATDVTIVLAPEGE